MIRIWRGVLDLLFPRRCPFCERVTGKELRCDACRHTLSETGPRAVVEGSFGRCASPFYYEGAVRKALLAFKFQGRTGASAWFGLLMADCAAEWYSGTFDTVTWVPVSRQRRRKRGYDQTFYLARSICACWDTAPVATLCKVVDTPPQSSLKTAEERRANVLGAYEAAAENVCGKRLLLVDDVLTTGATLGECVRVLMEAGADDVVCLTMARVRGGVHSGEDRGYNSKVHE